MKKTRLSLQPNQGLTLLLAQKIAFAARQMKAVVILRASGSFADARNILSILAMCAAMGATIDVETYGPDETYAVKTLEKILVEEDQDLPVGDSSKNA
ncbi:MAG: HPr family phosphocarrier protein [Verrucomicrobiota bacterium]